MLGSLLLQCIHQKSKSISQIFDRIVGIHILLSFLGNILVGNQRPRDDPHRDILICGRLYFELSMCSVVCVGD